MTFTPYQIKFMDHGFGPRDWKLKQYWPEQMGMWWPRFWLLRNFAWKEEAMLITEEQGNFWNSGSCGGVGNIAWSCGFNFGTREWKIQWMLNRSSVIFFSFCFSKVFWIYWTLVSAMDEKNIFEGRMKGKLIIVLLWVIKHF